LWAVAAVVRLDLFLLVVLAVVAVVRLFM
jgi:hypothetical protein